MNKAFTPDAIKDAAAFIGQLEDQYLEDVAELLQTEIKKRGDVKRQEAILKIQQIAIEAGLSLDELRDMKPPKAAKRVLPSAPIKYQHPDDPTKHWSGRGRAPLWVAEWQATHSNLELLKVA